MNPIVPLEAETERLHLRQFQNDDWRDLHAYYSDEQATAYTMGRALTEGETWRAMASMLGHWQLHGYGPYAAVEKSSGTVVGTAGFWYPNDWPEPEIKWALAPAFWGKGFASEGARAVQAIAKTHLPDLSLISLIGAENHNSIALAQAVGAQFDRDLEFRGSQWVVYRHP